MGKRHQFCLLFTLWRGSPNGSSQCKLSSMPFFFLKKFFEATETGSSPIVGREDTL